MDLEANPTTPSDQPSVHQAGAALPKMSIGQSGAVRHKASEAAIRVAVRGFGLKKRPTLLPLIRSDFASSPTPLVQLHIEEALVAEL
jgi:hypothetical protein